MSARVVLAVARADFLERVRGGAFLATVAGTLWIAWAMAQGLLMMSLGDIRGVFNSAWTGTAVTLIATCMAVLPGFYVVKNAVARDRATGVGAILAATPIGRLAYAFGKALSNAAVLCTLLAILAVASAWIQWSRGEVRTIQPLELIEPFVLLGVPAMAFTAALAVLFECVPWLRGAFGNVAYFFLWSGVIVAGSVTGGAGRRWTDVYGVRVVLDDLQAKARGLFQDYSGSFILGHQNYDRVRTFVWEGVDWSAEALAQRAACLVAALAVTLLAALAFDRFDRRERPLAARAASAERAAPSVPARPVALAPLGAESRRFGFAALVLGELRIAAQAVPRAWWLVAAGLAIACWVAPLAGAWGAALAIAWIWPLSMWSALGPREAEHGTADVVFSAPGAIFRQIPAAWLAGTLIALALGAGVGVRLALAGRGLDLAAFLGGAMFAPALALAAGTWSHSRRAFEGLFVTLWYVGALQHEPTLDFTGASRMLKGAGSPLAFGVAALALVAIAIAGRARRLGA